jgi:hypothetical protein
MDGVTQRLFYTIGHVISPLKYKFKGASPLVGTLLPFHFQIYIPEQFSGTYIIIYHKADQFI